MSESDDIELENFSQDDSAKESNIIWSSQALERRFELMYNTYDPNEKTRAYSHLRKILYMFKNVKKSGALTRMRKRLPRVRRELGLTPEQLLEIDMKLGIIQNIKGEKS